MLSVVSHSKNPQHQTWSWYRLCRLRSSSDTIERWKCSSRFCSPHRDHNERDNLTVVKTILHTLENPESLIQYVKFVRAMIAGMLLILQKFMRGWAGCRRHPLKRAFGKRFSGVWIIRNGGSMSWAESTDLIIQIKHDR